MPCIPVGNGGAGDREYLAWSEVEQHGIGSRQLGERFDAPIAFDPTTEALQHRHERSAICCEPPLANGHPTRCASTPSISP